MASNYTNHPEKNHYMFEHLMAQIPPHISATFTDEQLTALRFASRKVKEKLHAIDNRVSVSFLGRKYYFVVLSGQEKYFSQHLSNRQKGRSNKIASIFIATALLLGLGTIKLSRLVNPIFSSAQAPSFQPTAIPWLNTEAGCQQTGRIWQEGTCWDAKHDPNF